MSASRRWPRRRAVLLSVLTALAIAAAPVLAGEVVMKSGFRVSGTVLKMPTLTLDMTPLGGEITAYPFLMVDDGMRRWFLADRQAAEKNYDVELAQFEKFDLKQRKPTGALPVESVGPFLKETQFNEYGHRQVSLLSPGKKPIDIFQAITQLRPQSCTVTSLNYQWEFSVATTSLPPEKLDAMLRRCIDPEKPEDRLAVARFYQQSGLYLQSLKELEAIGKDLPQLKDRVDEVGLQARQLLARRLLQELKHRRAAGQHRLAIAALDSFPTNDLGVDILRELRQFQTDYADAAAKISRVKQLLGDLQADLTDEQLTRVAPLRDEVTQQLDFETLPRLEPFLRLEKDETLSATEKLALAYSGWVVGDANAVTDFNNTLRWWQARFLVLQFLRATHPTPREQAVKELAGTEGVGVKTVEQLIPFLPPIIDTPELAGSQTARLTVSDPDRAREANDAKAFRYAVLLPQEFHPQHAYPLIIAMHEGGSSPDWELTWWGGDAGSPLQSQRHGYIVIAPEYLPAKPGDPVVAPAETIAWECLRDVRRRFVVDSDRIFIAGHGRGAEAACDVALARPDLFAGVIPISGGVEGDNKKLKENARSLAWYFVMGEFDFGLLGRNGAWLQSQMLGGTDVLVSQYKARGHESYYSEIHRLFEWLELHRRPAEPKEFALRSLRTTNVRLHWLRWSEPPRTRTEPVNLEARVLPGQTDITKISVRAGRGSIALWLNSTLIDLDKRLHVEVAGVRKFNGFLKPEMETVLEDLRQRGDRQRLHSVLVQID